MLLAAAVEGELDHARLFDRALVHAEQAAAAQLDELSLVEDLNTKAEALAQINGGIGQIGGGEVSGWVVGQVAGDGGGADRELGVRDRFGNVRGTRAGDRDLQLGEHHVLGRGLQLVVAVAGQHHALGHHERGLAGIKLAVIGDHECQAGRLGGGSRSGRGHIAQQRRAQFFGRARADEHNIGRADPGKNDCLVRLALEAERGKLLSRHIKAGRNQRLGRYGEDDGTFGQAGGVNSRHAERVEPVG